MQVCNQVGRGVKVAPASFSAGPFPQNKYHEDHPACYKHICGANSYSEIKLDFFFPCLKLLPEIKQITGRKMKQTVARIQIVLVVGKKSAGKTRYLHWLSDRLREKGKRVAGFLSIGNWDGGEKNRYFLKDLETGESMLLAEKPEHGPADKPAIGYRFKQPAFNRATARYREIFNSEILFLDEYGPLEVKRGGFYPALQFLLKNYQGILFISVRPSLNKTLLHTIKSAQK